MLLENRRNNACDYLSDLKNYAGFGYLPAIRAGLIDGLNLGGYTAIIVFLVFVYFILRRNHNFVLYSFYYIFGFIVSFILIAIGAADSFLLHGSYDLTLEVGYFIVIVSSLAFGCILFLDWLQLRKNEGKPEGLRVSFNFLVDREKSPSVRGLRKKHSFFGPHHLFDLFRRFYCCFVVSLAE